MSRSTRGAFLAGTVALLALVASTAAGTATAQASGSFLGERRFCEAADF
jgi:hypothetical protein